MNKASLLFYFFVIAVSVANSQNVKILFVDSVQKQLQDVDLYHNDLLFASSGKKSFIKIKKGLLDKELLVSKFGYKEILLKPNNDTTVTLTKSQVNILDLVELKDLSATQYLDSISEYRLNYNLYNFSRNMKIKKVLCNENDTLFYLKEKYKFKLGKIYLNPQNKVYNKLNFKELKNPSNENVVRKYYLNIEKKNTLLPFYLINYNKPISFPYNRYFDELISNYEKFDFTVSGKGEKLKIDFKPKKSKKSDSKQGYIIFNKYDYGVYEFYMSQIPNKKNKFEGRTFDNKKNDVVALVQHHSYFISYNKNEEEKYDIARCEEVIKFSTTTSSNQILNWNNYRAYEATNDFSLNKRMILDDVNFTLSKVKN